MKPVLSYLLLVTALHGCVAPQDHGERPDTGVSSPDTGVPDTGVPTDGTVSMRDAGSDAARPDAGPFDSGIVPRTPAALAEIPLNEWRVISGNTIRDVDPCPTDRCAWSAVEGLSGVVTNFRGDPSVVVVDLSAPDDDWFVAATTGDTSIEGQSALGFEWVPQLGGFIAWKSDRTLFLLTPPAGDPRTEPWVWTSIDASGVVPDMPTNGPYSKFQYVPELGIALVASSVTGPVFAVRLAEVE